MSWPVFPAVPPPELPAPEPVPQLLRDLVHERLGIHFEPDRVELMLEKLEARARVRGCSTYLDYYYILKYDQGAGDEWRRVMDAFSVQETYFWREMDQVHALVERVVPAWFKVHSTPLKIWSAACATGEEPYTIAIALKEAGWGDHPIEIAASDASEAALTKARAGLYRERSFRTLPHHLKQTYFTPAEGGYQLDTVILNRVTLRNANLVNDEEITVLATASVIFCRNVFIYFSSDAIGRVLQTFAKGMPGRGHLFVGASESLLKLTDDFELEELLNAFVYVRKPRSPA